MSFDLFVDERALTSRDALNKFQIRIKILEFDENRRDYSKRFGDRKLVKKILVLIRHIETEEIEEKEIDIEQLEERMKKERLFTSSNRWIPPEQVKNGFVVGNKHLDLLADAIALDIIKI